MDTIYIEKRFCFDCLCDHWLEVTPQNKEICHGASYWPQDTRTQYVKHVAHGRFEVHTKTPAAFPQDLALDWKIKAIG